MIHQVYYTTTINVGVHFVKQASRCCARATRTSTAVPRPSLYLYFPYPGDQLALAERNEKGSWGVSRRRRGVEEEVKEIRRSFRGFTLPNERLVSGR